MSIASLVQPIFAAAASLFADALSFRVLTAGTWSTPAALRCEIKNQTIGDEFDERAGARVKRMRATAKVYDTTDLIAPTLKVGDEIIDADSKTWIIDRVERAEIGNGIYRFQIVRDLPTRAEVDRGGFRAEGGA